MSWITKNVVKCFPNKYFKIYNKDNYLRSYRKCIHTRRNAKTFEESLFNPDVHNGWLTAENDHIRKSKKDVMDRLKLTEKYFKTKK